MYQRLSKTDYYLGIAKAVAQRGTCLRRNYGAILVKNDEIIATGYTGAPRGVVNCSDKGICKRQELGCKPGERYELCKSVHAEQNCLISASRVNAIDSTLYLYGFEVETNNPVSCAEPCKLCARMLRNAGVKDYYGISYNKETGEISSHYSSISDLEVD